MQADKKKEAEACGAPMVHGWIDERKACAGLHCYSVGNGFVCL